MNALTIIGIVAAIAIGIVFTVRYFKKDKSSNDYQNTSGGGTSGGGSSGGVDNSIKRF